MNTYLYRKRSNVFYKAVSACVAFTFIFSCILPPTPIYAQTLPANLLNLPLPGAMVSLTSGFNPPMVRGITIHPDNPLEFDFLISPGDNNLEGLEFRKESKKLIKYFLASLTVPDEELWVNLSPYEKDRIIPQRFGQTEMGRDMLAQDYILKQLSASLMYPEDQLGKKFWNRVYKKAYEQYGTTGIPLNTFNKIWIVPETAVVYEHEQTAFVIESRLKVMLEEDYLALENNLGKSQFGLEQAVKEDARIVSGIASEVVREILIPEIEKEVNEGEIFTQLRQIYNSVILASWYKDNLQQTLLGQIYVDQGKTKGVDHRDEQVNQKIYDRYVEAFKTGVYNYIKEDMDPVTNELIPRKYFSGGVSNLNLRSGKIRKDVRRVATAQQGRTAGLLTNRVAVRLVEDDEDGTNEEVVEAVESKFALAASPVTEITTAVVKSLGSEHKLVRDSALLNIIKAGDVRLAAALARNKVLRKHVKAASPQISAYLDGVNVGVGIAVTPEEYDRISNNFFDSTEHIVASEEIAERVIEFTMPDGRVRFVHVMTDTKDSQKETMTKYIERFPNQRIQQVEAWSDDAQQTREAVVSAANFIDSGLKPVGDVRKGAGGADIFFVLVETTEFGKVLVEAKERPQGPVASSPAAVDNLFKEFATVPARTRARSWDFDRIAADIKNGRVLTDGQLTRLLNETFPGSQRDREIIKERVLKEVLKAYTHMAGKIARTSLEKMARYAGEIVRFDHQYRRLAGALGVHIDRPPATAMVEGRVREVIHQQLGTDKSRIRQGFDPIIHGGADSMDTVEIVLELEKEFDEFDIHIDENVFDSWQNLLFEDIVKLVESKLPASSLAAVRELIKSIESVKLEIEEIRGRIFTPADVGYSFSRTSARGQLKEKRAELNALIKQLETGLPNKTQAVLQKIDEIVEERVAQLHPQPGLSEKEDLARSSQSNDRLTQYRKELDNLLGEAASSPVTLEEAVERLNDALRKYREREKELNRLKTEGPFKDLRKFLLNETRPEIKARLDGVKIILGQTLNDEDQASLTPKGKEILQTGMENIRAFLDGPPRDAVSVSDLIFKKGGIFIPKSKRRKIINISKQGQGMPKISIPIIDESDETDETIETLESLKSILSTVITNIGLKISAVSDEDSDGKNRQDFSSIHQYFPDIRLPNSPEVLRNINKQLDSIEEGFNTHIGDNLLDYQAFYEGVSKNLQAVHDDIVRALEEFTSSPVEVPLEVVTIRSASTNEKDRDIIRIWKGNVSLAWSTFPEDRYRNGTGQFRVMREVQQKIVDYFGFLQPEFDDVFQRGYTYEITGLGVSFKEDNTKGKLYQQAEAIAEFLKRSEEIAELLKGASVPLVKDGADESGLAQPKEDVMWSAEWKTEFTSDLWHPTSSPEEYSFELMSTEDGTTVIYTAIEWGEKGSDDKLVERKKVVQLDGRHVFKATEESFGKEHERANKHGYTETTIYITDELLAKMKEKDIGGGIIDSEDRRFSVVDRLVGRMDTFDHSLYNEVVFTSQPVSSPATAVQKSDKIQFKDGEGNITTVTFDPLDSVAEDEPVMAVGEKIVRHAESDWPLTGVTTVTKYSTQPVAPGTNKRLYWARIQGNDVPKFRELVEGDETLREIKAGSSPAVTDEFTRGGIDLNPALLDLQIKRDGNGIPLPMNLQPVGEFHIEGFLPVIINVTPVNLPLLLGWDFGNENDTDDYGTNILDPMDQRERLELGALTGSPS